MADEAQNGEAATEVAVDFVRHRNALLVRSDFGPLFVDYYLHLADNGIRHAPAHDRIFKDALAAFTLHCASSPRGEHIAWTINFQEPRLNLFFAGDNEDCTVVGRLFTENVRPAERNMFYCEQVPRRGAEVRRSVVEFEGADSLRAAETYHSVSEQRPARFFHVGGDEYAMLASHPDCDMAWFLGINAVNIRNVGDDQVLAPIERRLYRWHCGCNQSKIMAAIAPAFQSDPSAVFGDGESIRVQCPRCGTTHTITREAMEAHLSQSG